MNDKRRKRLFEAISLLERCEGVVDQVRDAELDSVSNYPENLQGTDVYYSMEQAVDDMDDAMEKIAETKELLRSAIG